MPRLSKIGAAALAAFGWTSGGGASIITASYLVVAGGASGGSGGNSGGGGAGGFQTGSTSFNTSLSYTVTVGAGGASPGAVNSQGNNGSNSQIGTLTASVGGGGGGCASSTVNGKSGGSGGGAGGGGSSGTGGSGTSGQGNAGGNNAGTVGPNYTASGGGGASAAGGVGDNNTPGNGGAGTASSISGSSVTYAGGGGGATNASSGGGSGGSGGGGTGAAYNNIQATAGTANTGGGGGGGTNIISSTPSGGNGGSGVVIIAYPLPQQFGGGVITTDGTNCIHTFLTSGTLSPINSLTASYLIVAGGGGGAGETTGNASPVGSGGGGAGGLLTSSGLTIDTNSTYLVTVGAGGAGGAAGSNNGVQGANSSFSLVSTAVVGGGYGATNNQLTGGNGGSGGGGGRYNTQIQTGGTATSGQGNAGGSGSLSPYGSGGGGGGAGGAGQNSVSASQGGAGGAGLSSSISGTATYYAGGGGGGSGGAGGTGGGGAAGVNSNGTAGAANTGGGGGSAGVNNSTYAGGNGGSGIVIISYAGSTQQMAGGTVTIVGGNVIHTFTSSGYLTPLKFVGNSLRFRSSATSYLSRTMGSPTSSTTMTWSFWVKRGKLTASAGYYNPIYGCPNGTSSSGAIIAFADYNNSTFRIYWNGVDVNTNQVFRDPAAWYHFVVSIDTTQATASNRIKVYVNGTQITSFGTASYPSQNSSVPNFNSNGVVNYIGQTTGATETFDGYLTEFNFIDGQALAPTAFGTFNSYGVWQPINYGGSYGTNGFYLPFSNNTSTTTLGYDFSPAGNNWTTNNISLTAGSTYDSMTDVPTLTSATAANYPVINPLDKGTNATVDNGNLRVYSSSGWTVNRATMAYPTTGKYYFEWIYTDNTPAASVGIATSQAASTSSGLGTDAYGWGYQYNGNKYNNNVGTAYGATYTSGDVIGVAFDAGAGTLTYYKNGVSQGVAFSGLTTSTYFPVSAVAGATAAQAPTINFGQQPFTYTPPSGFVALNTYNL